MPENDKPDQRKPLGYLTVEPMTEALTNILSIWVLNKKQSDRNVGVKKKKSYGDKRTIWGII